MTMKMGSTQLILGTILMLCCIHSAVTDSIGTIDDIQLSPVDSNSNNAGVVLIKSQNTWYGVCHFKNNDFQTEFIGKTWGAKEASAACKQLGYKGGWVIKVHLNASEFADKFVSHFDCSSRGESSLNNCRVGTAITNSCEHSRPAGIHCYSSFHVELSGGISPNAGRVEVKYDDMWASVCYGSKQNAAHPWSFANAQVVCKELGFPGTMLTRQGGQGQGTHKSTIYGYRCAGLEYSTLHECLRESPVVLPASYEGPSCGENNEAVVICAVPGYIGCFQTNSDTAGDAERTSHEMRLEANDMAIGICRHHCKDIGLQLACLYNGRKCLCRDTVTDHIQVEDQRCETKCSGENLEICGGPDTMSVYNANLGICDDPLNGTAIYYYGDIFNNFSCTDGDQLEGAKSIQCVMNASNAELQWSEDFPKCKERHSSDSHQQWDTNKLALAFGATGGGLAIMIIVVFITCKVVSTAQRRSDYSTGKVISQTPNTDFGHEAEYIECGDIDDTSMYLTPLPGPIVHQDSTSRHGPHYEEVYDAPMPGTDANKGFNGHEYATHIDTNKHGACVMVPDASEEPNSPVNPSSGGTFHGARVVLHTYLQFIEDKHEN